MATEQNQATDLEKDDIGIDLSKVDKEAEENKPLFTAIAQRDHWREKAKDPDSGKTYKELWESAQTKNNPPVNSDPQPKPPVSQEPAKPEQVSQDLPIKDVLKLKSEGFSDGEILDIAEQANSMGISVTQLLSNPTFKKGIEAARAEQKVNSNTPVPSQRGAFSQKVTSIKDLKSPAERQAAFDQAKRGNRTSESE